MRAPFAGLALLASTTVVPALAADASEAPSLRVSHGVLLLGRLPPVLADDAVARQLDTGLTTVFLFTVDCRGSLPRKGAVQVAIRYDLWDEVYRIERIEWPERGTSAAASPAALREWWRSAVLRVMPAEKGVAAAQAKVGLQVLPFSQAEQRDAQEWLLRSFRVSEAPAPVAGGASAPPGSPPPAAAASPVREFYGALLASSIGRRSLIEYSWTVPVTLEVP